MVELKDLKLQHGQKLRIKTEKEIINGIFERFSIDGTRIHLTQPQKGDGTPLGKMIGIYSSDIVQLYAAETETASEEKLFNPIITKSQQDRIQKTIEGYVYINQIDRKYHEALTDICESFNIGIHAENTEMGR